MGLLQRDFVVISKGLRGKGKKPCVIFESEDGEKLTLFLENEDLLDEFDIRQEFTFKLVKGEQEKLG